MTLEENNTDENLGKNNLVVKAGQYLTFVLANEEYGIDILRVVEIRGWEEPTMIPSAPNYVKGVINLRGNIIPVVNLRTKFKLPEIEYGPLTVLIVLQIEVNEQKKIFGIVVDAVSDVHTVSSSQMQEKPDVCYTSGKEYISALVTIKQDNEKDKLVIILDPMSFLDFSTLQVLDTMEKENTA